MFQESNENLSSCQRLVALWRDNQESDDWLRYNGDSMGYFGDLNLPGFAGLAKVVKHLHKFFHTLIFLSTQEFHVNTNMLNYYVFKCIPCMYDNINK